MKKLLVIVIAILGINHAKAQTAGVDTLVIKSSIACDHCLECGTCGARLDDAVLGVAGVKNVVIQPETNTITVYYKTDKTSPDAIRKAIAAVGYNADDVKAEPAGFKELDGCCVHNE